MDRTVDSVLGKLGKYGLQEGRELRLAHLARGHLKFTMMDAAKPANIAVNGDVVRRIGEYKLRFGAFEQALISSFVASIAAQQAMIAKQPQISCLGDRGT